MRCDFRTIRRCLYEIGFTPLDKLTLLTHGFNQAAIVDAFGVIDVEKAEACLLPCSRRSRLRPPRSFECFL